MQLQEMIEVCRSALRNSNEVVITLAHDGSQLQGVPVTVYPQTGVTLAGNHFVSWDYIVVVEGSPGEQGIPFG